MTHRATSLPPFHASHVHLRARLRDGGSALLRPLVGGEVSVLEGGFEGCGRLRLPEPARVDRRAVLALSGQLASRASSAAATSSSRRSEPCLATT